MATTVSGLTPLLEVFYRDVLGFELLAGDEPATEPAATSYGMRQVSAKDPDGFQLCFISPTRPG